jgi:hypothetical protein
MGEEDDDGYEGGEMLALLQYRVMLRYETVNLECHDTLNSIRRESCVALHRTIHSSYQNGKTDSA